MKKKLHVALVTETWRPEINGVAMTLGRMVDGLQRWGHRFTLIRPRQSRHDAAANDAGLSEVLVPGCPIPGYRGLRFGLPAKSAILRHWQRDRPDVVQVATEGPLGGSAIAAARALGIPVLSEFHTNFHAYSKHYGFGWLERLVAGHLRRLHNRSQITLVPTHAVANELRNDGYRSVRVVSRGVDTKLFTPERRDEALRAAWGISPDTLLVSYVGRLAPEKNIPLVLRAFAAIHAKQPEARLLLVGDGPMRSRLERETTQLANGSQPHPYLFAGMRRGEDLAAHYASSDLFLFPSLTETFGNVTSEALASGLCVLAYRDAAAAELIGDGENGRVVAPGDENAFIAAAAALATDRHRLAALRSRAAASVRHLDWDQVNERLEAVFHDVIASRLSDPADPDFVLVPD